MTDQPHFDAAVGFIINGLVGKVCQVEVTIKIRVQPSQHIEIEFCGHALTVIVCRVNQGRILAQINADQQRAVGARFQAHHFQQVYCLPRGEITDGRAGEEDQVSFRHHRVPRQVERLGEISEYRLHVHIRIVTGQCCGLLEQVVTGYIDRHIGRGLCQVIEQFADLDIRPGAEFNDGRPWSNQAGNFGKM